MSPLSPLKKGSCGVRSDSIANATRRRIGWACSSKDEKRTQVMWRPGRRPSPNRASDRRDLRLDTVVRLTNCSVTREVIRTFRRTTIAVFELHPERAGVVSMRVSAAERHELERLARAAAQPLVTSCARAWRTSGGFTLLHVPRGKRGKDRRRWPTPSRSTASASTPRA
jgi:hypothetical protein